MKKLLIIFFLFSECIIYASPKYIKLVDRVTAKYVKELKKEQKMFLCGYGGRLMTDVEQIDLSFEVKRQATIEEARILFVEIAENYLTRVNADTELRPYLRNYPFTIDNLELGLAFVDHQLNFQLDLAYVMYCKRTGHIVYNKHEPNKPLETIYEEPYSEALIKYKQRN